MSSHGPPRCIAYRRLRKPQPPFSTDWKRHIQQKKACFIKKKKKRKKERKKKKLAVRKMLEKTAPLAKKLGDKIILRLYDYNWGKFIRD